MRLSLVATEQLYKSQCRWIGLWVQNHGFFELFGLLGASDVEAEAEAEAGSGSAGSSYFLVEAEAVNMKWMEAEAEVEAVKKTLEK